MFQLLGGCQRRHDSPSPPVPHRVAPVLIIRPLSPFLPDPDDSFPPTCILSTSPGISQPYISLPASPACLPAALPEPHGYQPYYCWPVTIERPRRLREVDTHTPPHALDPLLARDVRPPWLTPRRTRRRKLPPSRPRWRRPAPSTSHCGPCTPLESWSPA